MYAIWFPVAQGLKVGFTTETIDSIFVRMARRRAARRGWDTGGCRCIWRQPGDLRTEAWMQATLAFRWAAAFEQRDSRISEWFRIFGHADEEVVKVLDAVYELVPADVTTEPPLTLF